MKTSNSFKINLGLSQDEIAMYLGITRSQWSMYVSGKRALPVVALQKLTNLLKEVHKNSVHNLTVKLLAKEQKKCSEIVKQKLIVLEMQLIRLNKKRLLFERKIQEIENARSCYLFCVKENNTAKTVLNQIENRINKESEKYNTINLLLLIEKIKELEIIYKNTTLFLKKSLKRNN